MSLPKYTQVGFGGSFSAGLFNPIRATGDICSGITETVGLLFDR